MKTMKWMLGLVLAGTLAVQADDLVLSLETSGKLTFNELTNATRYRVEWASTAGGSWTSFTGAAGQWLDNIPATGSGIVTASVPMWYRVVATVNTTPPPWHGSDSGGKLRDGERDERVSGKRGILR